MPFRKMVRAFARLPDMPYAMPALSVRTRLMMVLPLK